MTVRAFLLARQVQIDPSSHSFSVGRILNTLFVPALPHATEDGWIMAYVSLVPATELRAFSVELRDPDGKRATMLESVDVPPAPDPDIALSWDMKLPLPPTPLTAIGVYTAELYQLVPAGRQLLAYFGFHVRIASPGEKEPSLRPPDLLAPVAIDVAKLDADE